MTGERFSGVAETLQRQALGGPCLLPIDYRYSRQPSRCGNGLVCRAGMNISYSCDKSLQEALQALQAPLDERPQWPEVYTPARWHCCLPRAHALSRAAHTRPQAKL